MMKHTSVTQPAQGTTSRLRNRLAELAPDLDSALAGSWRVAIEEWLPAIAPAMDSFNSYPHLRNVELHIDQVIADADRLGATEMVGLRPIEIYVLLASILFHDLGRTMKGEHARLSARQIRADYGILGIPSQELAGCIALISLSHEPPQNMPANSLYDVVIDPYGEIRQRLISALLSLGDHMDGSHTRANPQYIKPDVETETKGLFRRVVRGIFADCRSQMVRVVLKDMRPWKDAAKFDQSSQGSSPRKRFTVGFEFPGKDSAGLKVLKSLGVPNEVRKSIKQHYLDIDTKEAKFESETCQRILRYLHKGRVLTDPTKTPFALLIAHATESNDTSFPLAIWQCMDSKPAATAPHKWVNRKLKRAFVWLSLLDWMVAFGYLHVRNVVQSQENKMRDAEIWPHSSLLAILLCDVALNQRALHGFRSELAGSGIVIRAWLLEHREHLYTRFGLETHEPVFPDGFLLRVGEAMWRLRLGVFGVSRFTYGELASETREPNISLVRMAVRRLSIIQRCERYTAPEGRGEPSSVERCTCGSVIWVGVDTWSWSPLKEETSDTACTHCKHKESHCSRKTLLDTARRAPGSDLFQLSQLIKQLQSPTI